MNTSVFVLLIIVSLTNAWEPLDPEQTRFIFSRCMENSLLDIAPNEGMALYQKLRAWAIDPADPALKCFVKCAFDKMGIYDGKKFHGEYIKQQCAKYSKFTNLDDNAVNALAADIDKLGEVANTCDGVYEAYKTIHDKHLEVTKKLFHGDKETAAAIYKDLGSNIRQISQSYFEFCENKHYPEGSANRKLLCDIRQYKLVDDPEFGKHTECIFRGLRYLDNNGNLDKNEILRDFKLSNTADTSKVSSVLDKCTVDPSSKALSYYKCLLDESIAEDFKCAFDYREIRSSDYSYILKGGTFDKQKIESGVAEVDNKQCKA